MPTNGLAPPDMPWLFTRPGQPNSLGPPALNYAAPPDAGGQTLGSAVADTGANAWQWLQDQRAESVRQGLLDPDSGLPTQKGLVDAARATAEGVMMGTTAPGIRAYHGSPHSFEAFDTSKIGTGEGAQAYGHGLYFAEKEGTARSYRDALTPTDHGFVAMDTVLGRFAGWRPAEADVREALSGHDALAGVANNPDVINAVRQLAPDYNPSGAVTGDALRHYRTINDAIEASAPKGSMYEVSIGADPEHFLHWDKPLSEQSQYVQDALTPERLGLKPAGPLGDKGWYGYTDETGRLVGRATTRSLPDTVFHPSALGMSVYRGAGSWSDPVATAERLKAAGIPGIRYLDQGSRGARDPIKLVNGQPYDPADPTHLAAHAIDMAGGDRAAAASIADRHAQLRAAEGDTTGADAMRQASTLLQSPRTIPPLTEGQPPGTHNYVVFDAKTIDILRKYGIAGLIAGGGAAAAGTQQQPPTQ